MCEVQLVQAWEVGPRKIKKKKYIYKERLFYKDCFIKIVYTNHRKIVKNLDEFFILYINITIK